MQEKHMYPIIKEYLDDHAFDVKAEIKDVDIVAKKNDKTLLIEMKKTLNTSLIYQGIERQKLSDYVYLAIVKPSENTLNAKNFKEKKAIVKRLGLGLIIVDLDLKQLTFLLDPNTKTLYKDVKKRRKLNQEFLLRESEINQGGITRTKIITAYRELAIKILDYLKDGQKPLKDIVAHTNDLKTTRILIDNHYGWFERVKRGIYTLSDEGNQALNEYKGVIEELNNKRNNLH